MFNELSGVGLNTSVTSIAVVLHDSSSTLQMSSRKKKSYKEAVFSETWFDP